MSLLREPKGERQQGHPGCDGPPLPGRSRIRLEHGRTGVVPRLFPLIVGTHPHADHIGGMPELPRAPREAAQPTPGGPARMVELNGLSKQALFQALAPLEAGRHVAVTSDPHDRRARVVRLSDRGTR